MGKYVLQLAWVAAVALAAGASPLNASCSVSSYDGVASAVSSCTSITLGSFTVPAGKALSMSLKSGTTVTVTGTIKFGYSEWKGPLVEIAGSKITFKGSGGSFDGEGSKYWDGKGDKGKTKPKFFRIKTSGGSTFSNIKLKNCPHQCVSINSASDTTLNGWTVDVSAGDSVSFSLRSTNTAAS
ncbi:hypothetical protein GWI33_022015 [Rhynchophorus ferrugineus]|uniref:Uncharacterized protein n=1 Tax=Rhynchophorus ferrugineus TaxID=354439 RepID=A0A834M4L0_RHYFE|nr:hypothetical protein GWI33_022015 [Rhynchophorus ferrugineus]